MAREITTTYEEKEKIAKAFLDSGLFSDTKGILQAIVKIMAGEEMGMGPYESMRDINIINGKTTLAAAQIAARIKKSSVYDFDVVKFDDSSCVLKFSKRGKPLSPNIEFGIEHAKKLGLAEKENYRKQARTMLYWRAVTMGARMFCPDVFGGPIYTPDELANSQNNIEIELPLDITSGTHSTDEDSAPKYIYHSQKAPTKYNPDGKTKEEIWSYRLEGSTRYKGEKLEDIDIRILDGVIDKPKKYHLTDNDVIAIRAALKNKLPEKKPQLIAAPKIEHIEKKDLPAWVTEFQDNEGEEEEGYEILG